MELACVKKNTSSIMKPILLSQISLHQEECRIKVRICRIWEATAPFLKGDIFSLECLLVDEEGFSMQASIRKQDAEAFRCQITEGNVYIIEKFAVIPCRKRFVAVDRHYIIQITKQTHITQSEDDSQQIPLYSFNFSIFLELEKRRHNDSVLTDIIGRITTMGGLMHKYIGETLTSIRNLEIEDSDKNILSVALWDKFAVSFDEARISAGGTNRPVIIILAGMTIRTFKEKVQASTCSASKIYFDLDIPEVTELLNSLQVVDTTIHRITFDGQESIPPQEEMILNRKTIAELLSSDITNIENEKFTCECKIIDIDPSYGWWYKACRYCKSAVKTYDDTFVCSRCGNSDQPPIPWYKLNSVVEDGSGVANFTIFGRVAQDLVRIPAKNLTVTAKSDQFTLPAVIKMIINQTHIFQVVADTRKNSTNIPSFKVLKIFTLNKDAKGKETHKRTLFLKSEDDMYLSPSKKQAHVELSEEISPIIDGSSSLTQSSSKSSQASCVKKLESSGQFSHDI